MMIREKERGRERGRRVDAFALDRFFLCVRRLNIHEEIFRLLRGFGAMSIDRGTLLF